MSINTFFEVEAKFAVADHTTAPDLTRLPSVASVGEPRVQELSSIYYDTADLRLTREKITLRRRTGGSDDGWHVKLPASGGRLELHAALGEPVDGQFEVPAELLAQVRAVVRNHPLAPIAQVDNHRSESTLRGAEDRPVAEFCDDRVTAYSLLPGGQRTTWREWEVELAEDLAGQEAGSRLLHAATNLLIGAGARMAASPSKLNTALGDSVASAPVPAHMVEPNIDEDSALFGVIEALRANRDKLVEYDPRVRRDEWDSVHQMRVATRELRSHIGTFSGIIAGPRIKQVQEELKVLAGILGRARDAEVVEERFLALLDSEDSGTMDEETRQHVREDMGAEYARAHRYVVASLNSERYLQLLDDIDDILADPLSIAPEPELVLGAEDVEELAPAEVEELEEQSPAEELEEEQKEDEGERPVGPAPEEVLAKHLDQAYRRVMRRHRDAMANRDNPELTLHEREEKFHDMRKSAKKLRYAAEAVGAATDLKTKRLYNACKDLQSSLGDFQDAVTSRDKLLQMAQTAHRRGEDSFGYGLLYQRERYEGLKALQEYSEGVKKIRSAYERLSAKQKKKKK